MSEERRAGERKKMRGKMFKRKPPQRKTFRFIFLLCIIVCSVLAACLLSSYENYYYYCQQFSVLICRLHVYAVIAERTHYVHYSPFLHPSPSSSH